MERDLTRAFVFVVEPAILLFERECTIFGESFEGSLLRFFQHTFFSLLKNTGAIADCLLRDMPIYNIRQDVRESLCNEIDVVWVQTMLPIQIRQRRFYTVMV